MRTRPLWLAGAAALVVLAARAVADREKSDPLVAFVHVGRGKVASTSIQEYLCSGQKDLVEKYNIQVLVPSSCAGGLYCGEYSRGFAQAVASLAEDEAIPNERVEASWGAHVQRCRLEGSTGAVPEVRQLASEAAKAGRSVMMSSEYFFGMGKHSVDYLREVFQDFELRVLVMVRHPARYLVSIWAQNWRQKRAHGWLSRDVAVWSHQQGKPEGRMWQVTEAFASGTQTFVEALGPSRVYVGSLEGFLRSGLTAGQAVMKEFCGVDTSGVSLEGRIHQSLNLAKRAGQSNRSLSSYAIEMLQFLRLFAGQMGGAEVPRWPLPRQMPHVEAWVRRLGAVMGDLWTCKDYADEFAETTRHFGDTLRGIEGVRLLSFGVNTTDKDQSYYHPGSMLVCHGDADGLKAREETLAEFLEQMKTFLDQWKAESWTL